MNKTLKPREKKFAQAYIENGGNASAAAVEVLGPAPKTRKTDVRAVQGHHLLRKIKEKTTLLDDYLPESMLFDKLKKLTNQKMLAYFVFAKKMSDEEITEHMKANGLVTVVIRESDKGKLAFYTTDDPVAISRAIDMGFKLRGSYAPEKKMNLNINAEIIPDEKVQALADKLKHVQ